MNTWTFYNPSTGELSDRWYTGPERMLVANTPAGMAAVCGLHDHTCNVVRLVTNDFGCSVPVVDEWQPPAPPNTVFETFEWDEGSRCYKGSPTLEGLRKRKWEEIKAWRRVALLAPTMVTPWGVVDTGQPAVSALRAAVQFRREAEALRGEPLDQIEWTMADNSLVKFDTDTLARLLIAVLEREPKLHAISQGLRARIAVANETELQGIAWPDGV